MNALRTTRHRDLLVTQLPDGGTLVVTCDSCGSAGEKPADVLQVPAYYCGRFTARVALMELLSSGAQPTALADAVSCEMEPTGREIIRGIRDELRAAGLPDDILTGSTEENFTTAMTALGVTAVGYLAGKPAWQPARAGDKVYCIGRPKVGGEVRLDDDPELAGYAVLRRLLQMPGCRDVIPAGSKGVGYEAEQAARRAGLVFAEKKDQPVDLRHSAGPACCLAAIFSADADLRQIEHCVCIGTVQPETA